jgi:hypothetical protein
MQHQGNSSFEEVRGCLWTAIEYVVSLWQSICKRISSLGAEPAWGRKYRGFPPTKRVGIRKTFGTRLQAATAIHTMYPYPAYRPIILALTLSHRVQVYSPALIRGVARTYAPIPSQIDSLFRHCGSETRRLPVSARRYKHCRQQGSSNTDPNQPREIGR